MGPQKLWQKQLMRGAVLVLVGVMAAAIGSTFRIPDAVALTLACVFLITIGLGLGFLLIALVTFLRRDKPISNGWLVAMALAPVLLVPLMLWMLRFGARPSMAVSPAPASASGHGPTAPPPNYNAGSGSAAAAPPLATMVTVFFATDRQRSQDKSFFGSARGASLAYGVCEVNIPFSHRASLVERPHWYQLEFSEDPRRHVMVLSVTTKSEGEFLDEVNHDLAGTLDGKVLLFVHGYNVSFADAALRTAQLAFDLDLRGPGSRGVAAFYRWPSLGENVPYMADESNAEWTQVHLVQFLEHFLSDTSVKNVYLIAHSMGSRPALRAVAAIAQSNPILLTKIHEVILAAPDIDAGIFRDQIAPVFRSNRLAGTLYVSSKDVPLSASMRLHGGYPRLRDPAAGPVVIDGIDTIDASDVDDGDFLGHSSFAARPVLLEDIFSLMNGSTASPRFGLTAVMTPTHGMYWRFRPIAP